MAQPHDTELRKAMRENLSPQAVAIIATAVHATTGNLPDGTAAREANWFADELIEVLGPELYNALLDSAYEGGA